MQQSFWGDGCKSGTGSEPPPALGTALWVGSSPSPSPFGNRKHFPTPPAGPRERGRSGVTELRTYGGLPRGTLQPKGHHRADKILELAQKGWAGTDQVLTALQQETEAGTACRFVPPSARNTVPAYGYTAPFSGSTEKHLMAIHKQLLDSVFLYKNHSLIISAIRKGVLLQ